MEKSLARFLRYHRAAGHSPKTTIYYQETVGAFVAFLKAHDYPTDVHELDVDMVREWMEEQRDRGLSDSTIATRVCGLKAFTN